MAMAYTNDYQGKPNYTGKLFPMASILLVYPLTHKCLRVSHEIVVWIYDTFSNKIGIKNDFTKYLKESC